MLTATDRAEPGRCLMSTQVVTYQVNKSTVVSFEIEPTPGFRPAGANEIAGKVRDAVGPAVEAAKVVLDKVKEACPDEVEVKFGVKVSGSANWLIAKAATEGSFEVTLSWSPDDRRAAKAAGQPAAVAPTEVNAEIGPAGATTGAPSGA